MRLVLILLLTSIIILSAPAVSLNIYTDTVLPEYLMDGELNLTGTYSLSPSSVVDDSSADFGQGTSRNLSISSGSLVLTPSLAVSILNNGNGVLNQGTGTAWDRWFWSYGITKADGTYYLYYAAGRSAGIDTDKDIGLATSTDGITFTKVSSNPVLTNGGYTSITNPVPYYNGSWHLYHSANDGGGGGARDISGNYAYSDDPINWTRYSGNPVIPNGGANTWDNLQVLTECILEENGSYKFYYTGDTGNSGDWDAGLATSDDGVNWKKSASNPVMTASSGWMNGDVKINSIESANGTYRAFLTGDMNTPDVGWAWSKDGETWYDSGSALISRKAGTIYSVSVGNPKVIDEGDHYKLYTLCNSGSRSIGCFKLVPEKLDGTYTSRVFDIGGVVRLMNVTWDTGFSVVGSETFQIRYGNASASMGEWTTLRTGSELANITARYYQYRVTLRVPKDWMTANIDRVSINYIAPVEKIEAIIDGNTPVPVDHNATGWSFNGSLDDGNHVVIVRITDTTGTTDEVRITPKVDLYPPTGSILIEEGRRAVGSTAVLIEMTASDTHPPIEMQLSRQPDFAGATWQDLITRETWQLLGDPEGNVTIYARFRDDAGRISETYNDSIIIDTTPPTGTLKINNGDKYTNSTYVDVSVTWADLTGVVAMMISNDRYFTDAIWEDPWDTTGWNLEDLDGERTVYVRLRDFVGWETTIADTIILDRTPPAASLSINGDDEFTNSHDVDLSIALYDSNPVKIKLANSDDPWPDGFSTLDSPTIIPWVLSSGPDGDRTVRMLVEDAAGNTYVTSDDIVLDTVPPSGQLRINGGAAFTNDNLVRCILTASDATSGLDRMRIGDSDTLDDIAWQTFKDEFTRVLPREEGSRTTYVELIDRAGNTVMVDATIILDMTPPEGTLSIEGGDEFMASPLVNLLIDMNDEFGMARMRLTNEFRFSDEEWVPYSTSYPWDLGVSGGPKTVFIEVRDNAGNVVTASTSTTLDLIDPYAHLEIEQGAEATLVLTVDGIWSANDNIGLASIAFSEDPTFKDVTWIDLEREKAVEGTDGFVLSPGDGLKVIRVRVIDLAGRTGDASASIWYVSERPEGSMILGDGSGWSNASRGAVEVFWTGGSEATHYRVSMSEEEGFGGWLALDETTSVVLGSKGGPKAVFAQLLGPHNVTSLVFNGTITLDLVAPVIVIVTPDRAVVDDESVTVSITVSDDLDPAPLLRWRVGGKEWRDYDGETKLNLKEGDNRIEVEAVDAAGNVATTEWTVTQERSMLVGGSSWLILLVLLVVVGIVAVWYWKRRDLEMDGV